MDWEKAKKMIVSVAIFVAVIALIFSIGRILFSDLPALISGYEEIAIEWDHDNGATETVKKPITAGDVISRIFENAIMMILSAAVLIMMPVYDKYKD